MPYFYCIIFVCDIIALKIQESKKLINRALVRKIVCILQLLTKIAICKEPYNIAWIINKLSDLCPFSLELRAATLATLN
ncbi:MAG TPA: hypothetical protein DCM62_01890 [Bacteroidales bacterium]|nr:hypothetical protein [Bacteroidales bacterium]